MKGRKKGKTKSKVIINDPLISPYFIEKDINMYTVHKEGNTSVFGYFGKLGHALQKCVDLLVLDRNDGRRTTIKEYIDEYKTHSTHIIKKINL